MATGFKYRRIADHLARGIQAGITGPGERLPSLREACRTYGASLMTALAAYRHLEAIGLVEALPRSGFRVRPRLPAPLEQAPTRRPRLHAFSSARAELTAELLAAMADPALVPLGSGWPSADHFPVAAFRRLTSRLLRGPAPGPWTRFSPPRGDRSSAASSPGATARAAWTSARTTSSSPPARWRRWRWRCACW